MSRARAHRDRSWTRCAGAGHPRLVRASGSFFGWLSLVLMIASPCGAEPKSASAPRAGQAAAPSVPEADDPYPKAALAYLVTVNGALLWAHAPDRPLPPASLTKIMTGLLLVERWRPDDVVVVGREAANATGSRLGLREGEQIRYADAFAALLVASANDACLALAAHAEGSVDRFVERMNRRAAELGLRATVFRNPCGLDAPGHVASGRDLLVLAKHAMRHPEFARSVASSEVELRTLGGRRLRKPAGNLLIGRVPGAIGVKTGFTNRAGKCLAAIVRRGSDEVVVILLNAPDRWWSASILIDDAFAALDAARR